MNDLSRPVGHGVQSYVFEREVCGEGGFLAVLVADRVDVSSCEIGVLIGFKGTS